MDRVQKKHHNVYFVVNFWEKILLKNAGIFVVLFFSKYIPWS